MYRKVINYKISLSSIQHQFNRNRNIIIMHGLMGSAKNFRTISKAPGFSKYVNTFLVDARNHGNSPHTSTHTIQDLADDLYEFITLNNLLDPERKLTLMGHSMGALAMIQFTNRYSEPEIQQMIDRVVIVDIPITSVKSQDPNNKTGPMLKKMASIDMSQSLSNIHKEIDEKAISKDIAGLMKTDIIQENGKHRWRSNINLLAAQGYDNISGYKLDMTPGIWKRPVELVYGQISPYYNEFQKQQYKRFYPQMSDDNFHKIQKAGHWVHFQNTKRFLQVMQNILKKDSSVQDQQ